MATILIGRPNATTPPELPCRDDHRRDRCVRGVATVQLMPARLPLVGLVLLAATTAGAHDLTGLATAEATLSACLRSAADTQPSILRARSSPVPRLLALCRVEEDAYRQRCRESGQEEFACMTGASDLVLHLLAERRQ